MGNILSRFGRHCTNKKFELIQHLCLPFVVKITLYIVLYFTVLYCTVLYCIVLYCIALYCTVLNSLNCTQTVSVENLKSLKYTVNKKKQKKKKKKKKKKK